MPALIPSPGRESTGITATATGASPTRRGSTRSRRLAGEFVSRRWVSAPQSPRRGGLALPIAEGRRTSHPDAWPVVGWREPRSWRDYPNSPVGRRTLTEGSGRTSKEPTGRRRGCRGRLARYQGTQDELPTGGRRDCAEGGRGRPVVRFSCPLWMQDGCNDPLPTEGQDPAGPQSLAGSHFSRVGAARLKPLAPFHSGHSSTARLRPFSAK